MTILVTGSSGWLGRHLVPALRKQGCSVVGLDVIASEHTSKVGSVADAVAVETVFAKHKIDRVIHAGALHKPDIARQSQQAFIDTNITGTLNLLEASVKHDVKSFVDTSTTSLMISQAIRDEKASEAVWLDESAHPLEPRNIYGVTKLAAENLCRLVHLRDRLPCIILRTSRFFPEEDDTLRGMTGANLKAVELLYRRATVQDMASAHIVALSQAPILGFDLFVISAVTPFCRSDAVELKANAEAVISHYFSEAPKLFADVGWKLPKSIGRVYDASRAASVLGFRAETSFDAVLDALRIDAAPSGMDDPTYTAPHAELKF